MGMLFKVFNSDDNSELLTTYCEKEAAQHLESIGGTGVDCAVYILNVIDTVAMKVIGSASICYGRRLKSKNLGSLVVTQLELVNFKWLEEYN